MNVLKKTILRAINFLLGPLNLKINSSYSGGRLFPESFRYLKQVLPQPGEMTVIDIGVADGTAELWSAFPSSQYRYLLIEANPVYAKQLEVFGKKMNAITEKVFCGDHDGMESFITDDSYDPGKASKYGRKTGNGEKRSGIPCFKLDTILKRHNLPQPYILKIDVEGAELDVLRGATEALNHSSAVIVETPVIVRNTKASSFGEIVSFMYQRGFAVFDIAEMSYHSRTRFLNLANAIFVKKGVLETESFSR